MSAEPYFSDEHGCWFVPVSTEFFDEVMSVEPVKLELRDGKFYITLLPHLADEERELLIAGLGEIQARWIDPPDDDKLAAIVAKLEPE